MKSLWKVVLQKVEAICGASTCSCEQSEHSNLLKVWADVTNDLLSQNNGGGADLLGITGYMHPPGRMNISDVLFVCFAIGPSALILPH